MAGCLAGSPDLSKGKEAVVLSDAPFTQGTLELEVGVGAFGSIDTIDNAQRPDVGFILAETRVGWMLNDPAGAGFLRGNFEALLEAYGAGIYTGPGDQIYGLSFILRYNFVQPAARFVPFFQLHGGGAYSDAAQDDAQQRLLGADLSFTLGAGFGGRFMINRQLALNAALEYRHFSNADLADRNRGLNALGGTLGLSFFY